MSDAPSVQFLYYPGCPSHEAALARLREAMQSLGVQADVEVIVVDSEERAAELSFSGSPTIRVQGQDISPETDTAQPALTCRIYYKADGAITPLPPLEQIRSALEQALRKDNDQ